MLSQLTFEVPRRHQECCEPENTQIIAKYGSECSAGQHLELSNYEVGTFLAIVCPTEVERKTLLAIGGIVRHELLTVIGLIGRVKNLICNEVDRTNVHLT